MMNNNKSCNTSIHCSVDTCAYHNGPQNCREISDFTARF